MPEDLELEWEERLVGVESPRARQKFRAVRTPCRLDDDKAYLPAAAKELLGVESGDRIHTVPFA
jgi:arginine N-succinyltransferase